jgi:hypothetical protein
MMLHERLREFRCKSVEKAREAGIPAYFLDESEGVLRVLPDGRKERILVSEGLLVVLPAGKIPFRQVSPS